MRKRLIKPGLFSLEKVQGDLIKLRGSCTGDVQPGSLSGAEQHEQGTT